MLTLAIVGRPNVGKSTLFNALVGKRLALVHDRPGVTRDWRSAQAELYGDALTVIDTAGVEDGGSALTASMRDGTLEALARADVALLLIDGRAGITAADRELAAMLRKAKTPGILGVTKAEHAAAVAETMAESYGLGLGAPVALSAPHSQGFDDLHDALEPHFPQAAETPEEDRGHSLPAPDIDALEGDESYAFADDPESDTRPIKLAIVGRPNVGKSTLLNALLGRARALTGPEAGVTRDAVEVAWHCEGHEIRLVDTAGLRKQRRVTDAVERMAGQDSLRAVRLAQVVALVIDATTGVERQDLAIAGHALDEGRALIVVVNKWDAIKERAEALEEIKYRLGRALGQRGEGLPVVTLSALTGRRVDRLMGEALALYGRWNARVGTGALNRWLAAQVERQAPPLASGRPNKIKYMTQIKTRPPRFVLWTGRPEALPESYLRFLAAGLRRDFAMEGVALRIDARTSKNPYA